MNLSELQSFTMMKSMRSVLLLLFPLSLITALGCSNNKAAESKSVSFDSAYLERYIPLRADIDTPSLHVVISYVYPSGDDMLTEIFNGLLFGDSLMDSSSPENAMEGYAQMLGEDYRSNNAEANLQGLPSDLLDYIYKQENTIAYCDTGLISTRINTYLTKAVHIRRIQSGLPTSFAPPARCSKSEIYSRSTMRKGCPHSS